MVLEERLAYLTQLRGLEWNASFSADRGQCLASRKSQVASRKSQNKKHNSHLLLQFSRASQQGGDRCITICPQDIDDGGDADDPNADPMAPLDSLYRMDEIRNQLIELRNAFKVAETDGTEPPEVGHFVFTGAPGTGKTTVARVMAKILSKLKILARDHVEETTGTLIRLKLWLKEISK